MKKLLSFDEFVNESLNKSQFNKLDYEEMANAIIEDPSSISFISGDKFASIVRDLRGNNELLKSLVDSINIEDLKLWPLTCIADVLPEYGQKVLDVIASGKIKEKMNISQFFDLYNAVPDFGKMSKILKYVPTTILIDLVNFCPTLIELITPEMCAKSALTSGKTAYYHCLSFITLPDEFVTIRDKQDFIDGLSKNVKKQLKSYSDGDLNMVGNSGFISAFSNQNFVGPEGIKFLGKYSTNLKADTAEGLEYFNKWATQLTF